MSSRDKILNVIDRHLDSERFRQQHWEGGFFDYLEMVLKDPRLARNAFQRVFDLIGAPANDWSLLFGQLAQLIKDLHESS